MRYWLILLLLWAPKLLASPFPDFTAVFTVYAFDMNLATSKQTLQCKQHTCTLTALTEPTGLAKLFTNVHYKEQSFFHFKNSQFVWEAYRKQKFEGNRLTRTVTLKRLPDHIEYVEEKRAFPVNTPIYDALSLPFAIAYMAKNNALPDALYLQDNNWQDKLVFTVANKPQSLDIDTFTNMPVRHFQLKGQYAIADLWLQEKAPHLPFRIEILNTEKNKRITLQLEKEYHATQ